MLSPVILPRAPRLTWFAQRLRKMAGLLTFGSLLRELAPEKYAALRDKSTLGCYVELLRHLDTLFPIDTFIADQTVEDYMENHESAESLTWRGVPVETQGVDIDEYDGPESIASPVLAMCLCFSVKDAAWSDMAAYNAFPALSDFAQDLPQPCAILPRLIRPPRRRVWIEPWNGLRDLFCYAKGITGYSFLDLSHSIMWEGGMEYPPWNLDEIHSLAQEWKQARLVLERADALAKHIEAQPYVRLPLLAGALSRDRDALREITYPVHQGKTLADVFERQS